MAEAIVKVNGLEELGRALLEFGPLLGKKYLARATYTSIALIQADAQSRAPVLTGALEAHIAVFKRPDPDKNTAHYALGVRRIPKKIRRIARAMRRAGLRFNVEGDASYWWHVEFGTAFMPANPFFRNAFEATKQPAIEVFRITLADGVAAAAAQVAAPKAG